MTARCICIVNGGRRCHRPAALVRMGDLFICTRHSMWTMLLIDDGCAPETRRMLAYNTWRTVYEAQRLIDRFRRTEAA